MCATYAFETSESERIYQAFQIVLEYEPSSFFTQFEFQTFGPPHKTTQFTTIVEFEKKFIQVMKKYIFLYNTQSSYVLNNTNTINFIMIRL